MAHDVIGDGSALAFYSLQVTFHCYYLPAPQIFFMDFASQSPATATTIVNTDYNDGYDFHLVSELASFDANFTISLLIWPTPHGHFERFLNSHRLDCLISF